jgi:hypothetical protein
VGEGVGETKQGYLTHTPAKIKRLSGCVIIAGVKRGFAGPLHNPNLYRNHNPQPGMRFLIRIKIKIRIMRNHFQSSGCRILPGVPSWGAQCCQPALFDSPPKIRIQHAKHHLYLLSLVESDCTAGELERVLSERMDGPFAALEPDWKKRVRNIAARRGGT